MEVGWELYVLVMGSAAAAAWYVGHVGEEIAGILRARNAAMSHDVDRVVEHINALERQLKQVCEELRQSQGLDDGDSVWRA